MHSVRDTTASTWGIRRLGLPRIADFLRFLDGEPVRDADRVGEIVCFVIRPQHAGRTSRAAAAWPRATGCARRACAIAKGNPRPAAVTAAEQHFGPLSLYLSAGFFVHRTDDDGSVFVRKSLVA